MGRKRKESESNSESNEPKNNKKTKLSNGVEFQSYIDSFDLEVEFRIRSMRMQAKDQIVGLEAECNSALMKFPAEVRKMTLKQFLDEHNGEIDHARRSSILISTPGSAMRRPLTASTKHSDALARVKKAMAKTGRRPRVAAAVATAKLKAVAAGVDSVVTPDASSKQQAARQEIAQLKAQLASLMEKA